MQKEIFRIAVIFLVLVLAASVTFAQKSDGKTRPAESVCDVLIDATPGLYGLCIAFCEAQDCEPDFTLANPFENCRPGSQKVLDNYNGKKRDGDPEMPCIRQGACPCWTEEELNSLGNPPDSISYNCGNQASYYQHSPGITRSYGLNFGRSVDGNSQTAFFSATKYSHGEKRCNFYNSDPFFSLSPIIDEEQYQACLGQLKQHSVEWSFACFE